MLTDRIRNNAVPVQGQIERIEFRVAVAPVFQVCRRQKIDPVLFAADPAGCYCLAVFVRDRPIQFSADAVGQFRVPVGNKILAGNEPVCDPGTAADVQCNTSADPRPFRLIPLRRKTAVLTRTRTERDAVVRAVNATVCAAVIVDIADNDNDLVFPAGFQQIRQIEIRGCGVAGHCSGKMSVAENTAAPHGGSDRQNCPGIRLKFRRDDFPVVTAADEK